MRGVSNGAVLAALGVLALIFGVITLVYGLAFDTAARDFASAAECGPEVHSTDCLQRRPIEITGTGTGRYGQVTTVDFLDSDSPHESHLGFGARNTSVLHAGASGIATRWRGMYTNLDVAGIDFATDENPFGQHLMWFVFGLVGVAFALVFLAASLVWYRTNRSA